MKTKKGTIWTGGMIFKIFTLILLAQAINPLEIYSQLGFFSEYWQPKTIEAPAYIEKAKPEDLPVSAISVNVNDTIRLISPYVGGYNLNTYNGGKMYDKPFLLENVRNLDLPFFRYPGGSGSNWYFWDHSKPDGPDDVDTYIIRGEVRELIKWGDEPGEDYLSLNSFYRLRDSCQNEGIHVVNYPYARYGRSEHPVQQAAHYAADWVRYDNGRTKFWEIGNEIYGAWEPGYVIDTSLNLDGQPLKITGELYARHCLVFLDSMRAAAAEVGAEIKIGATLGFQKKRTEWDIPILQILGDKPDFYIVHKYFGNSQDAGPYEVLESIDEFYEETTHTKKLINLYCETYVPLVLTEWNTRYYGRYQNVTCTNGMHNLLGLKGIINEGFGLSCKWNLVWRFKDGDTHGLISSEKDNPAIEGIPTYSPRAPYFYMDHFKKFLGDVSVNNSTGQTDSIDIFSSSFQSGHSGVVLINRAKTVKNIAINMTDYVLGERYYWYTLTSANGDPFSRKVKINGQTNIEYDAGGPLNYNDIEAWSANTIDGICLELPPFSATYVLTEGSSATLSSKSNATFNVYEKINESTVPLQNAIITIDQNYYFTDFNGKVVVPLATGDYEYTIKKEGYETLLGGFNLTEDTVIKDTTVAESYSITVNLFDADSKNPIEGALVELNGQAVSSDTVGSATFSDIKFGSYDLLISGNEYYEEFSLEISSDSIFILHLDRIHYVVTFQVIDSITLDPVRDVKVLVNAEEIYTSITGESSFMLNSNTYDFSLEKAGYFTKNGIVTIEGDTTISINFIPSPSSALQSHDRQLSIFPNPSQSHLNITTNFPIRKIHISDLLGKIVLKKNIEDLTHSIIDISLLGEGIYFVSIFDQENRKLIRKIIKSIS